MPQPPDPEPRHNPDPLRSPEPRVENPEAASGSAQPAPQLNHNQIDREAGYLTSDPDPLPPVEEPAPEPAPGPVPAPVHHAQWVPQNPNVQRRLVFQPAPNPPEPPPGPPEAPDPPPSPPPGPPDPPPGPPDPPPGPPVEVEQENSSQVQALQSLSKLVMYVLCLLLLCTCLCLCPAPATLGS